MPLAGKKAAKAQNIAHFPLRTPLFLPKTRKNRTLQRAKTWYTIIKFQSMKDEAADLCYDAKTEAGIAEETETEVEE